MYDDILLPTDGSPAMGSIIEQGIHQATQNEAILHALYVVDVRAFMMLPEETANEVVTILEQEGKEAVQAVQSQAEEHEVEVTTDVVVGVPHEAILSYAEEHDIALIVMGTHGQTGDEKRVVGSVAEEVIRKAEVPVLVVRMSEVEREETERKVPEAQRRYVQ